MMAYGEGGSVHGNRSVVGLGSGNTIPSDTGRVVRDTSTPQLESCAFIDVARNRSLSLSLISPAGVRKLGITKFEAKIGQENEASICMFKKLHFKEVQ